MKENKLQLWLTGKEVPTPVVSLLLNRPALFSRGYRAAILKALREDFAARRTPESLIGNLFAVAAGFAIQPTKVIASTATKVAIDTRLGRI